MKLRFVSKSPPRRMAELNDPVHLTPSVPPPRITKTPDRQLGARLVEGQFYEDAVKVVDAAGLRELRELRKIREKQEEREEQEEKYGIKGIIHYADLRRIVVGSDGNGYEITMRCFTSSSPDTVIPKLYYGRFAEACGLGNLHKIGPAVKPQYGEDAEEVMRKIWFNVFEAADQDIQSQLTFHDDTRRMLVGFTEVRHDEVWVSWMVKEESDGSLKARLIVWSSKDGKDGLGDIDDVINLNTLVKDINVREPYDWKVVARNLLGTRYGLSTDRRRV